MTREIKTCECGRTFETSRTGKTVRCHECRRARRERRAGRTTTFRVSTSRVVSASGKTCTVVVSATGGRCGARAVHAFETDRGEVFAECAHHHVG